MAEEKKKSALHRPKFLLFLLYVGGFVFLRFYGHIVFQSAEVRGTPGLAREYVVGTNPMLPRWQRQVYRAIFSPLMILEEEGRRVADQGMGDVVQNLGDSVKNLIPQS